MSRPALVVDLQREKLIRLVIKDVRRLDVDDLLCVIQYMAKRRCEPPEADDE